MRRRSLLLEDLIEFPWPIRAVFADLCYPIALAFSTNLATGQSQISEQPSKTLFEVWVYFSASLGFASLLSFTLGLKKNNLNKQSQTLKKIRGLTWRQFDSYISEHFKTRGYLIVGTSGGPDDGVDLVLRKDDKTIAFAANRPKYTSSD